MLEPDDHDQARDPDDVAPGVRAARTRAGLTQKQVADRMNVPLDTYRRWDQGRNTPGSPALLQLLATVLRCPIDVLYPPADNPYVATALRTTTLPDDTPSAERNRRAEQLSILDLEPLPGARGPRPRTKSTPKAPCEPDDTAASTPLRRELPCGLQGVAAEFDIPTLLATIDDTAPGVRHTGTGGTPNRRMLGLAATLAGAVVLTVLAFAAFSGPGPTPIAARTEASVRSVTSARSSVATTWAKSARIAASHERRRARGTELIRLADLAAGRGDLRLADARLDLARDRYDTTAGTSSVRRHVNGIRARRGHRREQRARRARTHRRRRERRIAGPAANQAFARAAPRTTTPTAPGTHTPTAQNTRTPAAPSTTSSAPTPHTSSAASEFGQP